MTNIAMAGPWITEHEEKIVLDALRNGWYGKQAYYYVETFETEFACYHDRKHALMTPNCTTALHLLLAGLNIADGDEVIAPECTWIGSTACITYQRARPVFADIDPQHWCLTPESIERAITPQTKAVIVVDLYGNMPDWNSISRALRATRHRRDRGRCGSAWVDLQGHPRGQVRHRLDLQLSPYQDFDHRVRAACC